MFNSPCYLFVTFTSNVWVDIVSPPNDFLLTTRQLGSAQLSRFVKEILIRSLYCCSCRSYPWGTTFLRSWVRRRLTSMSVRTRAMTTRWTRRCQTCSPRLRFASVTWPSHRGSGDSTRASRNTSASPRWTSSRPSSAPGDSLEKVNIKPDTIRDPGRSSLARLLIITL